MLPTVVNLFRPEVFVLEKELGWANQILAMKTVVSAVVFTIQIGSALWGRRISDADGLKGCSLSPVQPPSASRYTCLGRST